MTPPVDPWTGVVTVTFDPTLTTTVGGTVAAFTSDIPALGSSWDYVEYTSGGSRYIAFGNDCNLLTDSCVDQNGSGFIANNGFLTLDLGTSASTINAPTFTNAEYTTTAGGSGLVPHFSGSAGTFTTIPEPGSLGILAVGFALIGAVRLRLVARRSEA